MSTLELVVNGSISATINLNPSTAQWQDLNITLAANDILSLRNAATGAVITDPIARISVRDT